MSEVKPHKFPGVYVVTLEGGTTSLATRNMVRGKSVYGEPLVESGGEEYRLWNPYNSKLAAAILRGLPEMLFGPGDKVLYLGAATGTTVSHVSDILGDDGLVYAVEFSSRPARELVSNVASLRRNVYPVIADARLPERYRPLLERVDAVYSDVAQPEQAKILADNADLYLKPEGGALLAVKARSISAIRDPSRVFAQEADVLRSREFNVKRTIPLRPYDKAHAMIFAEYRGKA